MPGAQLSLELPDAQARRRALLELHRSFLVEAGAGSGKTSLLAGRVAFLLASGHAPREIVAITFTEAAASELLERIENDVHALVEGRIPAAVALAVPAGLSADQMAAITRASNELDEITCTTIHGFCKQLITPYPVEADIDPGAAIADPVAAQLVHQDLQKAWLSERFGRKHGSADPEPNVSSSRNDGDDFLIELVRNDSDDALRLINLVAKFFKERRSVRAPIVADPLLAKNALCELIAEFSAWYDACGIVEEKTAAELNDLRRLRSFLDDLRAHPVNARDLCSLLLHERPACCHSNGLRFKNWQKKTAWTEAAKIMGRTKLAGETLAAHGRDLYERCGEAYTRFVDDTVNIALARFLVEFDGLGRRYAEYKRRTALLDFDDLLFHARDLLAGNEAVRRALSRRYPRILVDEFQDTDPLQAEILWRLCGEGETPLPWDQRRIREGSLFLVGDPKQAIYRFRGADIDTYLAAKQALLAQRSDAVLEIQANFRSDDGILAFVNERFAALLSAEQGQPGFSPLIATKTSAPGRPAVAVFDVPLEDRHKNARGKLLSEAVRREEATALAEALVRLIGSYPVRDPVEGDTRPCRAGDIALLAPTGTDLWIYERALELRGIPIATQAGKGFFRRQEVQDLIALIRTIADPGDTVAFGALIRGPLVGLSDEEIADAILALGTTSDGEFRRLHRDVDPQKLAHPLLRASMESLQRIAAQTCRTTPYHVLVDAIETLDVRSIVRARHVHAAERGLANIELFLEMARSYDVRGFTAFAHAMREKWEDRDLRQVEGRPDAQQEAVSLITMHSAKGLEWPIVVPINSTTELRDKFVFVHRRTDDTVHFKVLDQAGSTYESVKDEEKAQQRRERVRLWYVALTRPRDLLLLPRQSEHSDNDWMSLVSLPLASLPLVSHEAPMVLPQASDVHKGNLQDSTRWADEAARITSMRKRIFQHAPSRHFETTNPALALFEEELFPRVGGHLPPTPAPLDALNDVQGGRERGIVLHKLMEEVLSGETFDTASALAVRARELLAQRSVSERGDERAGLNVPELVACVQRGFAVPEIQHLRSRLLGEVPVYDTWDQDEGTTFLRGVVDALVLDAAKNVEVVVDWKSDIDPDERRISLYCEQMREYLVAAKAKCGLLVFLSSGKVIQIERDFSNGPWNDATP